MAASAITSAYIRKPPSGSQILMPARRRPNMLQHRQKAAPKKCVVIVTPSPTVSDLGPAMFFSLVRAENDPRTGRLLARAAGNEVSRPVRHEVGAGRPAGRRVHLRAHQNAELRGVREPDAGEG